MQIDPKTQQKRQIGELVAFLNLTQINEEKWAKVRHKPNEKNKCLVRAFGKRYFWMPVFVVKKD